MNGTPSLAPCITQMPAVIKANTFHHYCQEGHPKDRPVGAICPVQKQGRTVYGEFKDSNKPDRKVDLLFIVIISYPGNFE